MTRLAGVVGWVLILPLLAIAGAGAHPLGNFTINHLAVLRPSEAKLHVHYVLDIAEIPTFQVMHASGDWTPAQRRAWEAGEAALVASGLSIRADGIALVLHLERTSAALIATAAVLVEDISGWESLYSRKRLVLPA